MTIEQWNVLFSAATFVVIAVTAIAATIQLRHLRARNFEYLAVQSALWMRSHPTSYPTGVLRFKELK